MTLGDFFALSYRVTRSRGLVTREVTVGWFWVLLCVAGGVLLFC